MKNIYTYILVGSIAVSFHGDAYAVDVQQWINDLEQITKRLGEELSGLRQCIVEGTCTKKRYEQIKELGKKIVITTAALVGVALIGKFAGTAYHKKMEPQQYVKDSMRGWNISINLLENPNAKADYDYIYAATTLSKDEWRNYRAEVNMHALAGDSIPSQAAVNLATYIRKQRWHEEEESIWGLKQIRKYSPYPLERPSQ
jgi:hypothetical protein